MTADFDFDGIRGRVCYCTGACRETGICPRTRTMFPRSPWNPEKQRPHIPVVPTPAPGRERVPVVSPPTEIYPCQACKGTGKRRENRKTVVCSGCHGSGVHRV